MNLWNKLAALFSPTRRLVNDDQGEVVRGGPFGGRERVVGRGECQYRREDMQALAARKRLQAGKLAAARHRPSPTALVCMAWTGGALHLWFWEPPSDVSPEVRQRWIPESLLLAPPATDGVRLLKLAHGYEAQVWQKGVLAVSHWWERMPAADTWLRFVRSAGLDPAVQQEVPDPVHLPWAERPWGETSWTQHMAGLFDEKAAWVMLAAALAVGLGWQMSSYLRWRAAGSELSAQLDRMRAEVAPLLAARERAEQAQAELQRLQALRNPNVDYMLMADIVARLPEGSTLLAWHREAAKLQTTVRSNESDPRAFVTAFESDPRLSSVAVTPLAGGIVKLAFELPASAVGAGEGTDE